MALKGRWHYLEQNWWAEQESLSFEPPGETHTFEVPRGCEEMCTLFHATGAYVYVDPDGEAGRPKKGHRELGKSCRPVAYHPAAYHPLCCLHLGGCYLKR